MPEERVRAFNPRRRAKEGSSLRAFIESAAEASEREALRRGKRAANEGREPGPGERTRARKRGEDQRVYGRQVEAILCDLIHEALERKSTGKLIVSRDKGWLGRSRYAHHEIERQSLIRVMDELVLAKYVTLRIGSSARRRGQEDAPTFLAPGPKLSREIMRGRWTFGDIRLEGSSGETLRVKTRRAHSRASSYPVEYEDTSLTKALRDELGGVNEALASADIRVLPWAAQKYDTGERRLVREFTYGTHLEGRRLMLNHPGPEHFALHGRLYGGFWESMATEDRAALQVDGETIEAVDFQSSFVRLLYLISNVDPPAVDDLYAVPGLEGYRKGVKRLMTALLFCRERGLPGRWSPRIQPFMPEGMAIGEAVGLIRTFHSGIAHHFGTDIGMRLFKIESDVLMTSVKGCLGKGITALPLHDALMVPFSRAGEAGQIMFDAYATYAATLGVDVKERPLMGAVVVRSRPRPPATWFAYAVASMEHLMEPAARSVAREALGLMEKVLVPRPYGAAGYQWETRERAAYNLLELREAMAEIKEYKTKRERDRHLADVRMFVRLLFEAAAPGEEEAGQLRDQIAGGLRQIGIEMRASPSLGGPPSPV